MKEYEGRVVWNVIVDNAAMRLVLKRSVRHHRDDQSLQRHLSDLISGLVGLGPDAGGNIRPTRDLRRYGAPPYCGQGIANRFGPIPGGGADARSFERRPRPGPRCHRRTIMDAGSDRDRGNATTRVGVLSQSGLQAEVLRSPGERVQG
jgi:hypothetical protein